MRQDNRRHAAVSIILFSHNNTGKRIIPRPKPDETLYHGRIAGTLQRGKINIIHNHIICFPQFLAGRKISIPIGFQSSFCMVFRTYPIPVQRFRTPRRSYLPFFQILLIVPVNQIIGQCQKLLRARNLIRVFISSAAHIDGNIFRIDLNMLVLRMVRTYIRKVIVPGNSPFIIQIRFPILVPIFNAIL